MSVLEYLSRAVDDRPMAAHVYVTDRCNLDCTYCNEYDNSKAHPSRADLERWIAHVRALGVSRLVLQGGEPLLHPDIVELVAFAKGLGFYRVGLSTNGLLLTRELLRALERAGLDTLQLSIDRVAPSEATRKSLKSLAHKLAWFEHSDVALRVSGVLLPAALGDGEDALAVVEHCLARGISAQARVVHEDGVASGKRRLYPDVAQLLPALERQREHKLRGAPVHTSWSLLDYQRDLVRGQVPEWRCVAGYKYFFVSAQGRFWLCSQARTDTHILDVTLDDLAQHDRPKPCQAGCGVYCIVDTSLGINSPARYLAREARGFAQAKLVQLRSRRKPIAVAG